MKTNEPSQTIPDPLLVKTEVFRCASCNAWWCRVPAWCNGEGIGEQCDKCGNTSTVGSDGRPWGPKSEAWPYLMKEWAEYKRLNMLGLNDPCADFIFESVVMPPDFKREPQNEN